MKSVSKNSVVNYSPNEIHGSASHKMDDDSGYESLSGMLLWLKGVAIDHYSSKASSKNFRESWSQILTARKVLNLINAEVPWKRRKLFRLLGGKMKTASDLLLEKPNEQITTKRGKCSFASSFSCLINCADSEESADQILQNPHGSVRSSVYVDTLSTKWIPNGRCFQTGVLDSSQSNVEVLPLLDSDDSISGSNLSSPTKSVLQTPHKLVKLLKSVNHDQRKLVYTSVCKEVPPLFNLHNSVNSSNSLSSNNPRKRKAPQRPVKLWNFIDDYHSRMAIPVGPRFQADIPNLTGLANRDSMLDGDANSDNSEKWVGTRIWPIEGTNAEISREVIGKGRPCSCSCRSPGSPQCIKHHVFEKRLQLQLDLTSAFFRWKFDEMGEEVSRSWSLKEQKSFTDLVRMNPVSKNMSFLKPALKLFPSKSRESLVSYYFNVYVLRRMSMQTRLDSDSAIVDSDDDETTDSVGRSNDIKERYLIGLR